MAATTIPHLPNGRHEDTHPAPAQGVTTAAGGEAARDSKAGRAQRIHALKHSDEDTSEGCRVPSITKVAIIPHCHEVSMKDDCFPMSMRRVVDQPLGTQAPPRSRTTAALVQVS
jgi:hypothetical protein